MDKRLMKDAFGWGFLLWLFGYVLGFILYFIVPPEQIGYFITPFGVAFTLWILAKRVQRGDLQRYLKIALVWTLLAIVLDYLFIVQLLKPEDGYYKPDIYLYYALTFLLPIGYGWWISKRQIDGAGAT